MEDAQRIALEKHKAYKGSVCSRAQGAGRYETATAARAWHERARCS